MHVQFSAVLKIFMHVVGKGSDGGGDEVVKVCHLFCWFWCGWRGRECFIFIYGGLLSLGHC